ncbi:unnamed protein product [Strongylus vulgaris]|uniref:Uncharacterized protein n=1 Tax=Strongylus vulgaris TaxID=40348 RepID=A0A3P7JIV0_STRVU|nr:unnamed protein product [Strongylus vulgaris]
MFQDNQTESLCRTYSNGKTIWSLDRWLDFGVLGNGSFQQMWIAKSEYDETGRTIVENRCP